jgi:hypothetical protein
VQISDISFGIRFVHIYIKGCGSQLPQAVDPYIHFNKRLVGLPLQLQCLELQIQICMPPDFFNNTGLHIRSYTAGDNQNN